MNRTDEFVLRMRALACTYCGAQPGEWCRSKSGRRKSECHATRFYAAKERWSVTYNGGATE